MRSLPMSRFKAVVPVIAVLALLFSPISVAAQGETEPSPDTTWGRLALWFVPLPAVFASGQQYEARTSLGHFTFDSSGYTFLALDDAERAVTRVRMEFRLGRAQSLVPSGQLSGIVNDFRGADPSAWRSNIPTYSRLTYRALYPGIDLQYEGRPGRLKSLYVVSPGADANHIRWEYEGADSVSVTRPNGELWIRLPGETGDERYLIEAAPVAWQELGSRKAPVTVTYDVAADGSVGFDIGEYDPSRPLIIDPFLSYAVVIGGPNGAGAGVFVAKLDPNLNRVYLPATRK